MYIVYKEPQKIAHKIYPVTITLKFIKDLRTFVLLGVFKMCVQAIW